jgi:hypothetical protein
MEYKVLESDIRSRVNSSLAIERNVREYLADGWQTASQLMMVGDKFYQAMTRETQEVSITVETETSDISEEVIIKIIEGINKVGADRNITVDMAGFVSVGKPEKLDSVITTSNPYQVDTRLVVKKSGEFTELEELGLGGMITIEKYARDVRMYDCYLHKQDRNTPITFEELEEYFTTI